MSGVNGGIIRKSSGSKAFADSIRLGEMAASAGGNGPIRRVLIGVANSGINVLKMLNLRKFWRVLSNRLSSFVWVSCAYCGTSKGIHSFPDGRPLCDKCYAGGRYLKNVR